MSERYKIVFSLPQNLYVEESPVIITAGNILKDNQTNNILVQLKIKNISNNVIKAAKVDIVSFDTSGKELSDKVTYEYLDLNIYRDEDFGQKTPIQLSDKSTRSISVCVTEIYFTDNSVWKCDVKEWCSLTEQENLIDVLSDGELVKQYKIEYGESCEFYPIKDKDLWVCSCGALNKSNEEKCHICKNSLDALISVNIDELKTSCTERITKQKRLKKKIFGIIAVVLVFILTFSLLNNTISYKKALSYYESGDKILAMETFIKLGDYKDSQQYLNKFFSEDGHTPDVYNYIKTNKSKFKKVKLGTDFWHLGGLHKDYYCDLGEDLCTGGEMFNRDLNTGYYGEVRKMTDDIYLIYNGDDFHILYDCDCYEDYKNGIIVMKRLK